MTGYLVHRYKLDFSQESSQYTPVLSMDYVGLWRNKLLLCGVNEFPLVLRKLCWSLDIVDRDPEGLRFAISEQLGVSTMGGAATNDNHCPPIVDSIPSLD